jgi:ABC-type transport system involved in resistance to organic solvents, permease component
MEFLLNFVERTGAKAVGWWNATFAVLAFLTEVLSTLVRPATWNRATLDTIVKQIYFTAVQILHVYLVYVLAISWVIITITLSTARDVGLFDAATEMIIRVLLLELLPFLTALLIALRSGSAINTEVALMKVNNELDALSHCRVEPMQFEFLPRIAGGIASVIGLTVLGSVLTLFLAYFSIYGLSTSGFDAFSNTISTVFGIGVLMGLGVKCIFFGLAVTTLPMAAGLETPKKLFMVPVSVLRGMMRVFLALVLIEVLSLALEYI